MTPTCGAPGCTREPYIKGLCNAHYLQSRRHPGRPFAAPRHYSATPDESRARKKKRDALLREKYWSEGRLAQWSREWRNLNRDKVNESKRAYARRHPEQVKAWSRASYAKHRPARIATSREYGKRNRTALTAQEKRWRNANRERVRRVANARLKKKRTALDDYYVAQRLGLPMTKCPRVLIEAKRAQLMGLRLIDQMENA